MTYNDWRDELKSNLLSVSDEERRRVLDYYAEAYADRREAGYSEKEIIRDFGAPYDAAQRILLNICDDGEYIEETQFREKKYNNFEREEARYTSSNDDFFDKSKNDKKSKHVKEVKAEVVEPQANDNTKGTKNYTVTEQRKAHPFLFLLLCVLLAIPMFVVVMALCGVSIGFIVAPLAMLIGGVASIGFGIYEAFSNVLSGVFTIGEGLVALGLGIILVPLIIKFVKFLWKLIKKFVVWLGSIFSGKETRV